MKTHLLSIPPNAKRGSWVQCKCLECGTLFYARHCYVKRGQGKFCSISCGVAYRNKIDNPAWKDEVKQKIVKTLWWAQGKENTMQGRKGELAPGYKDGRTIGPNGEKLTDSVWRLVTLKHKKPICELCNCQLKGRRLYVHHKDHDRTNNSLNNLMVVCPKCHNNVLHKRKRNEQGQFVSEEVVLDA